MTPRRVDVRVGREHAAALRAPGLSIIDGQPAARTVAICCLPVFGRLTMTVPVDEETARRFERTCRGPRRSFAV